MVLFAVCFKNFCKNERLGKQKKFKTKNFSAVQKFWKLCCLHGCKLSNYCHVFLSIYIHLIFDSLKHCVLIWSVLAHQNLCLSSVTKNQAKTFINFHQNEKGHAVDGRLYDIFMLFLRFKFLQEYPYHFILTKM